MFFKVFIMRIRRQLRFDNLRVASVSLIWQHKDITVISHSATQSSSRSGRHVSPSIWLTLWPITVSVVRLGKWCIPIRRGNPEKNISRTCVSGPTVFIFFHGIPLFRHYKKHLQFQRLIITIAIQSMIISISPFYRRMFIVAK